MKGKYHNKQGIKKGLCENLCVWERDRVREWKRNSVEQRKSARGENFCNVWERERENEIEKKRWRKRDIEL